jgi:hypothetical protein
MIQHMLASALEEGGFADPEMAVIYMTGDSGADWASKGVPKSVLVTKPFAPAQIVAAIAQLLNATG